VINCGSILEANQQIMKL